MSTTDHLIEIGCNAVISFGTCFIGARLITATIWRYLK
jgi:hypothetical protein